MERIEISAIKTGLRFTKPVFFDDGKNMFIEAGIHIKPYHVAALTKWSIPFLLSDGRALEEGEELPEEVDSIEELDDVDTLEEVEEVSGMENLTEVMDVASIDIDDSDGFVDFLEEL